ncbi:hypothetical protein F4859DRAFT_516369 [Xylaria cf. heliscus]|nr:hypothetical protein F4859DRAFT_516369 [Xylaria cf. heliscus]
MHPSSSWKPIVSDKVRNDMAKIKIIIRLWNNLFLEVGFDMALRHAQERVERDTCGKLKGPIPLPGYEQVVFHIQDCCDRFYDYWPNSTSITQSGLPVEAYSAPVGDDTAGWVLLLLEGRVWSIQDVMTVD